MYLRPSTPIPLFPQSEHSGFETNGGRNTGSTRSLRAERRARRHVPFCRQLLTLAAIAAGLSIAQLADAAATPDANEAAPKDCVLFMGIDVLADARNQQQPRPVVGGSESAVVVLDENGTSVVSRDHVVFSAALEPKVSQGAVTIEDLEGQPIHSPNTDPIVDLIRIYNINADRQEAAEQAAIRASMSSAGVGLANAMIPDNAPNKGQAEAAVSAASAQTAAAVNNIGEVMGNTLFEDTLQAAGHETGIFDGFKIVFHISSPKRYSNAYGVLKMVIHDPSNPELEALHAFQVFKLPDLDAKPRKVVARRFRLPVGFTVDSYEVHVYVDGEELATNRSQNRVEVTKEEALQFLIFRYKQENKGASLEPQVAQELRPEWPRAEFAPEWENITVNLSVTSEGKVEETNVAGTIGSALDDELDAAVRKVLFLPALIAGEPIPSTATFALGELFRTPERQLQLTSN